MKATMHKGTHFYSTTYNYIHISQWAYIKEQEIAHGGTIRI